MVDSGGSHSTGVELVALLLFALVVVEGVGEDSTGLMGVKIPAAWTSVVACEVYVQSQVAKGRCFKGLYTLLLLVCAVSIP